MPHSSDIRNLYQPSEDQQLQEHWKKQQREMLEQRLGELQTQYPQWWTYSDTLGERPIDGMIREIERRQQEKMLQDTLKENKATEVYNQYEANRRVAPEYTDEVQKEVPTNMVLPMGKVL